MLTRKTKLNQIMRKSLRNLMEIVSTELFVFLCFLVCWMYFVVKHVEIANNGKETEFYQIGGIAIPRKFLFHFSS